MCVFIEVNISFLFFSWEWVGVGYVGLGECVERVGVMVFLGGWVWLVWV